MGGEDKTLVRKVFHEALHCHEDYDFMLIYDRRILTYLCGLLSVQDEKAGFANFLTNLSLLRKLDERVYLADTVFDHRIHVLEFLIVQMAAILLYDGDCILADDSKWRKYDKLKTFLFADDPELETIVAHKAPAFGINDKIKEAIANNDVGRLKLLVDMAPEPEKKLKNIYGYLVNNRLLELAENLNSIAGNFETMIPAGALYDAWWEKIQTSRRLYQVQSEWEAPDKYPLHRFLLGSNGYKDYVFTVLRAQVIFTVGDFQELQEKGFSMDVPIDSEHPSLTLRAMWHFYAEFADDLLALDAHGYLNKSLMNHVRSAKNFILWEKKAKRRDKRYETAKNA